MTLDEQMRKLPDKLRAGRGVLLSSGADKREAARTLNWGRGDVTARLKEARERLRRGWASAGFRRSRGFGPRAGGVPAVLQRQR